MAEVEIEVIFFAKARELVGRSSAKLNIQQQTTVQQIKYKLIQTFPNLEQLGDAYMLALNEAYLESEEVILSQNDELALIPPISGG